MYEIGAERAGFIDVDMTYLKDQQYHSITLSEPSEISAHFGKSNKKYWRVEFDLVMILDGRNLRFEARWPPAERVVQFGQAQSVQASKQICIAAAFKPGTA